MFPEKKVTVLYGTQTGNSEDVAGRVGRQIFRLNCKCNVFSLGDYPIQNMLTEYVIIFVCSTTGNGEYPENMKAFWKFLLRKNLPSDSLCNLKFCVFGLGDSSYEKFNVVAKKLRNRLLQLGGTELIPATFADDQHELGYDAALDPWLLSLKEVLTKVFSLSGDFISEEVLLPPRYNVSFLEENESLSVDKPNQHGKYMATLISNERVTAADHFQAVHHLKFSIEKPRYYEPGDVAVVWPENPQEEVEEFLSLLKVPLDTQFKLVTSDPDTLLPDIVPYPCTVRQCAKSYFDFLSVPRRSFFEFFHHFSQDELEKEKLFEFTTAAGQEELYDYANRPRRNILEVLKDFPNTTPHVPFEYLFEMIPAIRPRSFSIASSISVHKKSFHLLVAVVEYQTRLKKPRKGLCSNWITKLAVKDTIPFSVKHGSIRLPDTKVPIICIGPGTGCAPFRSFIEERASFKMNSNYLFFGCRYKRKDFLFRSTWQRLKEKDALVLFTAFSRDQEDKVYVQHKIAENGDLLWGLIHKENAVVYVAGNSKQMPKGVREAFLEIFKKQYNSEEKALEYLTYLEYNKRYQSETWA